MREVAFIKKNKDNWLRFESMLKIEKPQAEKLNHAFDVLNNDLAYARTYYPKSKLVDYLNSLSEQMYHQVYKPSNDWSGFYYFFSHEIPLIAYQYRKYIYFSLLFFIFTLGIGALSMHYDEDFARTVLGDEYVNQTIQNIQNGDPTAIYNNESFFEDSSSAYLITVNNLMVGLMNFFYGLIGGVGSIYIMFSNGVRIGAFLKMFDTYNTFWESMRSIWIHGGMELFAMTVEGAAGIILGFSYLFPGSLKRRQSFLIKGKQAVKLVISTFPFTIAAGILEGYVTQYGDDLPLGLSLAIIFGCFGVIVYYYLIRPIQIGRKLDWKRYNFSEMYEEI